MSNKFGLKAYYPIQHAQVSLITKFQCELV